MISSSKNRFDERFDRLNEDRMIAEDVKAKLIQGVLELGDLKRAHTSQQKELAEKELEASKLEASNHELRVSLMKSLIEKEDLETRKNFLLINLEKLSGQIQNMEKDTSLALCSQRVKAFCERNSSENQLTLIDKIVEAKHKLIKYGFIV